ncbi:DEBR0S1_27314g1_1 [Brettanomyces bruxellensis]|uniref:DEBR0S1_27314g1_1 n=1 Tax=Dekkera bruxellensis TaxID=5007 RepID=A0A7D9CWI0_DEKBR|nr:DEBR0S1_27314g1_1 [Brettanomyces bruxellensis]
MASIAIVSGGTATNSILDIFQKLSSISVDDKKAKGKVSYILPISDNGGSTSEIIRVLGGCSVGDIRSRITRLIPDESSGIRDLLSHRLPNDSALAKQEWEQIIEGSHTLWANVDPPCKQILRSFLIHVHVEILKRSRNPSKNFRLELASVGNMFLTGARLFCGSLDSSIELMLRLSKVPPNIQVLPCINTNFTYHISALLADGTIVTGQSQISHPSLPSCSSTNMSSFQNMSSFTDDFIIHPNQVVKDDQVGSGNAKCSLCHQIDSACNKEKANNNDDDDEDDEELEEPSYIHPELRKSQLYFNKNDTIPLPSPIKRIFYISPFGEEIYPVAHSRVLKCFKEADTIIYSIGSLMTSIIPILILQGVGDAILQSKANKIAKNKVLLMNGSWDRETHGMSASDFINAIYEALKYSMLYGQNKKKKDYHKIDIESVKPSSFITHVIFLRDRSRIPINTKAITDAGIECVPVDNDAKNVDEYDLDDMYRKLRVIG